MSYPQRWLRGLAVALVVESLVSASLRQFVGFRNPYDQPVLSLLGRVILPAALGAFTLVLHRKATGAPLLRLAALIGIGGMELCLSAGVILQGYVRALGLLEIVGNLIIAVAAPALWGSALARLELPGDLPLQATGRKFAGLVQLAFVFRFVGRVQFWGGFGSMGAGSEAFYAVWSLTQIADSVVLLWASIEAVRTTRDADAVRYRAGKIHRWMRIWIVVVVLSGFAMNAVQLVQGGETAGAVVTHFCTLAQIVTSTMIAVFAVAWACGAQAPTLQFPASGSLIGRSGDVESTGDPS